MNKKENAPASAGTPTGARVHDFSVDWTTKNSASQSITENNDNFTDKTAKRIFEVLGAIYAKENGLDVDVTVYKNGKVV